MTQSAVASKNIIPSETASTEGWWKFNENKSNSYQDSSSSGHTLNATGSPECIGQAGEAGAVMLDGTSQWLSTEKPVLQTDKSFSIVAWVRLDSSIMNGKLALKQGEHAITAVSQDSPTHSGFYLGVREIEETQPNGDKTLALKWNFTISPVDGSETGVLEWQHAHTSLSLDDTTLDKWVLLVGVCDVVNRCANIYVPSLNEKGSAYVPDAWNFWKAQGGFQIGRGLWLGRNVDQWSGSVGPVRAFSGVLTSEDAKRLYNEEVSMMSSGDIAQPRK